MSEIPKRTLSTLMNALSSGVVPRRGLEYIAVGRKKETETFVNDLIPKVVRTNFYSIMLDTLTAEHGARMTAMHIASDNADRLSQELKIQYNKARQNVITNELIDIVGGAEALNG